MKLSKVFLILTMLLVVLMAGCNKKDDLPGPRPKVTSTDPVSEAANIGISSNISAIFDGPMKSSSITATTFTVMQGTTIVPGTTGYTGNTATFNPAADLSPNTLYTATITTGAQAATGLSLGKDYIWKFTTGGAPDLTKPTVTLTDPLNNATGVSTNKLILVTFSEPMDPSTITSLTYTLKQGTVSVSGTVSYTGSTATFTPSARLAYSKTFTGTITTGAKDIAGNAIAAGYTFSFTTLDDTALPYSSFYSTGRQRTISRT